MNLVWGKPVPIGDGSFVVWEAAPTPEFWQQWKLDKAEIKRSGISVTLRAGRYVVMKTETAVRVKSGESNLAEAVKLSPSVSKKLRPYQVEHTEKLAMALSTYGAAIDGSDTGTGKSLIALALCLHFKYRPFIIAPKASLIQWQRYCLMMGVDPIEIINPQMLRTCRTQWLRRDLKDKFVWILPENSLVIFDEAHWAKGNRTQIGSMVAALRDTGLPVILLSATIGDNPLHFKNLGYVLRLFPRLSDFYSWVKNHGCFPGKWGGLEFSNEPKYLRALHDQLFKMRGSRIKIADLPSGAFPETQISLEYVDTDEKLIQRMYTAALDRLCDQADEADNHLVAMLRFRQIAEIQKISSIVDLAQQAVAEGNSVAIFVNFIDTLNSVAKELKTECVICGDMKLEDRNRNIDAFQSDRERIIILQVASGGQSISLHDTNGKFPRYSIISPPWSAIQFRQVCGRVHRDGGKTKSNQVVLIAAGTVEERVAECLQGKLERIDLINDADLDIFKDN